MCAQKSRQQTPFTATDTATDIAFFLTAGDDRCTCTRKGYSVVAICKTGIRVRSCSWGGWGSSPENFVSETLPVLTVCHSHHCRVTASAAYGKCFAIDMMDAIFDVEWRDIESPLRFRELRAEWRVYQDSMTREISFD